MINSFMKHIFKIKLIFHLKIFKKKYINLKMIHNIFNNINNYIQIIIN